MRLLIVFLSIVIMEGFIIKSYFVAVLIHSGTGLSGNGTFAFGTLDKLFTLP